jgi:hypothetical protein
VAVWVIVYLGICLFVYLGIAEEEYGGCFGKGKGMR